MSVCLIVQKQDEIFIGTDTAVVSPNANNKYIRIGECEEKFFVKDNIGFYCSGRIEIADKIREYINNNGFNLEQILDYLKLLDKEYHLEDSDIELVIVSLDKCLHIAKYDNFEPIEYKIINNGDMYIISAGFKVSENYNKLYNYIVNDNKRPLEAIRETIKDSMCQEIGGKCKIFHLNKDGFKLAINERLDNLALRYKITNAFLVNGEVLIGKLIAGNQLVIKNSANTFLVDEKGAKLKNAELSVENDQNKILLDPDNGFKIQKKVSDVMSDVAYLDTDGNFKIKGDMYGGSININNNFIVAEDGTVQIKKGSLDIGDGNFTVDINGNIKAKSAEFEDSTFNDGEIIGSSISVNDGVFSVSANGHMIAESAEIEGLITASTIESSEIFSSKIYGGAYYSSDKNSKLDILDANEMPNANVGAGMALYKGESPIFYVGSQLIGTTDLYAYDTRFLRIASDGTIIPNGAWNFGGAEEVDFSNVNVKGLNSVAKFA